MTGIMRRYRGAAYDLPAAAKHFVRNWMVSRYGMVKTSHAIRRKGAAPVGLGPAVGGVHDGNPVQAASPHAVHRTAHTPGLPGVIARQSAPEAD